MPCMKCSNGKYKYGAGGSCVFDTLAACHAAAAAIHVEEDVKPTYSTEETMSFEDMYRTANKDK